MDVGRCDRGAAAVSFGGGCLECGAVPAPRRASRVGLVDVLTAHYGSPGRLANYRRQFEKISRAAGTDLSIFVNDLETLAMKKGESC